jgi:hypothetical protein
MSATGEPYSVAARMLASADPAGDVAPIAEVLSRLGSTLAAPSARMEYREDLESVPHPDEYRPGPVGRLVGSAVMAVWERVAPEEIRTRLRGMNQRYHNVAAGVVEPAAGRYQMSYRKGSWAKICIDGEHFSGLAGRPLDDRHKDDSAAMHRDDPLAWLRLLQGATEARYAGGETLRGTSCRKVVLGKILLEMGQARPLLVAGAKEDPAEFTVWIDEEHIRQVTTGAVLSGMTSMETKTLELWDFGVLAGSLDWTRFPEYPE